MKRTGTLLLISILLLVLVKPVQALTERAPVEKRYVYQLVPVDNKHQQFHLYVDRSDVDDPALHTGSIALGAELLPDTTMSFAPDTGWATMPVTGGQTASVETGKLGTRSYLAFTWYWEDSTTDLPNDSDRGTASQYLGIVSLGGSSVLEVADIQLLPWPETPEGSKQVSAWQSATDPEAYLEIVQGVWRMTDTTQVNQGYYQGYYAAEHEGDTPGADQYAVDIFPGWQHFMIGAYAGTRPVTLTFYKDGVKMTTATATFGTQIGHFRGQIDFAKLSYDDSAGRPVDGTYDILLEKQSHVSCALKDVTFTEGSCEDLRGVYIELPCGDVDEDGEIRQTDRGLLTMPARYGNTPLVGDGTLYDLDGDDCVDQMDLAILIAPANYGKMDFIMKFGAETSGSNEV